MIISSAIRNLPNADFLKAYYGKHKKHNEEFNNLINKLFLWESLRLSFYINRSKQCGIQSIEICNYCFIHATSLGVHLLRHILRPYSQSALEKNEGAYELLTPSEVIPRKNELTIDDEEKLTTTVSPGLRVVLRVNLRDDCARNSSDIVQHVGFKMKCFKSTKGALQQKDNGVSIPFCWDSRILEYNDHQIKWCVTDHLNLRKNAQMHLQTNPQQITGNAATQTYSFLYH
ncbi:uncharacterized protein EV154DRAFT_475827 [Mucor mucedo]|uniref:uncharacterized protein n=1 Tax=Mucor mucedo TaxID=29922 RepID=UPI002220121D|nr:uncharacterized protein EV154DRAFT_475827 [Mucor mucedo]KAI7897029.1 hypothetical protein EV154DRAFT_475827 [Mucor mucedo]